MTVFFTAGLAALAAAPRLRVLFFAGSGAASANSGAGTFLGRPRGFGAAVERPSSFGAATAAFFAGRPRVVFGPAAAAAAFGSASAAASVRGMRRGARLLVVSSSPSFSSALVLRFAAALFVLAVADTAVLALADDVKIFVVLTVDSLALAAARARVIRFGGDSITRALTVDVAVYWSCSI